MSQAKLKSIAIRNWQTVEEARLDFPESGLVLVHGVNDAARGKFRSIGAGKTALGEAISRTLLGVNGRYTHLGHYSRNDGGDTLVSLSCDYDGKPLVVDMSFKYAPLDASGEALRFAFNGQETRRDRIYHTRLDLEKMLTVNTDLANWTVHLDGDQLKFGNLGQKSAVELLMTALMQPPWTDYHQKVTTRHTAAKRELESDRANLGSLKQAKEDADYATANAEDALAKAKSVYETALAEHKQKQAKARKQLQAAQDVIAKRDKEMKALKKSINENIEASAQEAKRLEIELKSEQEALRKGHEKLAELKAAQKTAAANLRTAEDDLETLLDETQRPKNCPTCGQPWASSHSKHAVKEQETKVAKARSALDQAEKTLNAFEDGDYKALSEEVDAIDAELADVKAKSPVRELSEQYEDLETTQNSDRDDLVAMEREASKLEAKPTDEAVVRAETVLDSKRETAEKAQKAVNDGAARLAESDDLVKIVGYWQEAFSPRGIPNMILRDAIGPLNATAKRISSAMTGGLIEVSYATDRALATGKQKAELNITVANVLGSRRADGSSKGEASLINLIVAETLAEVGNTASRIGYRWYDEVGANQDEVVRRAIFSYLRETAERCGILIFLVTHNPEAASYAHHVLVATKSAVGGTTYAWER
jgi:DNA repair exonuclease SbcCD ATPase subunit